MMKTKLLACLFFLFVARAGYSQYLAGIFQDEVVNMQSVTNDLFATANLNGSGNTFLVYGMQPAYAYQEFLLVSTSHANWYKIRHQRSLRFLTVHVAVEGQSLYLEDNGYGGNTDYQEFQFVAQTEPGRYKIHSRFQAGAVNLILEIDPAISGPAALRLGKNITVGNSEHQKFDLNRLYPDVDPSSATASLNDRFQGRTVGFTMKHNGYNLDKDNNISVVQLLKYNGFNAKFKVEYTNETGWYKIKYKSSGLYLTIDMPAENVSASLKPDANVDDNYQKFKFIIQANDSTYKIHTKFSYGIGVAKVGLVLELPPGNVGAMRCARNNTSVGGDFNQQFILRKNLPNPSEFTGGQSTLANFNSISMYITNKESLAMLEPFISGADTLVRVQPNPVYGKQSEWVILKGDSGTLRFFYPETQQYLYVPAPDGVVPSLATRLVLRSARDSIEKNDRRYTFQKFGGAADGTAKQFGGFTSYAGLWHKDFHDFGNPKGTNNLIQIDDDGLLSTNDGNLKTNELLESNYVFGINPVLPYSNENSWAIFQNNGHAVSDLGVLEGTPIVQHIPTLDETGQWRFISDNQGNFWIQNELTGWYLSQTNEADYFAKPCTRPFLNTPYTKWSITRAGVRVKIKNVQSGLYLSRGDNFNFEYLGGALEMKNDGGSGTSADVNTWMLVRGDIFYTTPPVIPDTYSSLLAPYSPEGINTISNAAYSNKVMQNIGLPFEPSYIVQLNTNGLGILTVQSEGISTSPAPSFLAVVKSALRWQYNWSNAGADSALRNYKLDSAGHRSQVVYALREYVLKHLAEDSTTWTNNERQLVKWIQRQVKNACSVYGTQLLTSWQNWSASSATGNGDLLFSSLINNAVVGDFQPPDRYTTDSLQALSLLEFYSVSRARNYRSGTADLAQSSKFLPLSLGAGFALGAASVVQKVIRGAQLAIKIAGAAVITDEGVAVAATGVSTATKVSSVVNAISKVSGVASGVVTVITMATQILIQEALEVDRYERYNTALRRQVDSLQSFDANICRLYKVRNKLTQLNLLHDVDYVLSKGKRFDSPYNTYYFVGSGNWSNPANWSGNVVPPANLANNDIVFISHQAGGNCTIDVPIKLSTPGKIYIKENQNIIIASTLTVPVIKN